MKYLYLIYASMVLVMVSYLNYHGMTVNHAYHAYHAYQQGTTYHGGYYHGYGSYGYGGYNHK